MALTIAAAAPVMTHLSWDGAPHLLREYLVPVPGRGQFPFFPCASYIGFGLAAGVMVKRSSEDGFDRLMQWSALVGFVLVFAAQYLANIPASVFPQSNFWIDSPTLVLIRVGIMLAIMAGCYVWTQYGAGPGWSWMQCIGKNSLMVYWVHVILVYGGLARPFKRTMSIPEALLVTALVTVMMVALSAIWLRWKARRQEQRKPAAAQRVVAVSEAR
jgi:fucose 4-O-acetylase-like acetyltransferase